MSNLLDNDTQQQILAAGIAVHRPGPTERIKTKTGHFWLGEVETGP